MVNFRRHVFATPRESPPSRPPPPASPGPAPLLPGGRLFEPPVAAQEHVEPGPRGDADRRRHGQLAPQNLDRGARQLLAHRRGGDLPRRRRRAEGRRLLRLRQLHAGAEDRQQDGAAEDPGQVVVDRPGKACLASPRRGRQAGEAQAAAVREDDAAPGDEQPALAERHLAVVGAEEPRGMTPWRGSRSKPPRVPCATSGPATSESTAVTSAAGSTVPASSRRPAPGRSCSTLSSTGASVSALRRKPWWSRRSPPAVAAVAATAPPPPGAAPAAPAVTPAPGGAGGAASPPRRRRPAHRRQRPGRPRHPPGRPHPEPPPRLRRGSRRRDRRQQRPLVR